MRRSGLLVAAIAAQSLWLLLLPFAERASAYPQTTAPSNLKDGFSLERLIQNFYVAWAEENVNKMSLLWNPRSPYFLARTKEMQQRWAEQDFLFGKPAFSEEGLGIEWAYVRVTIEMSLVDPQTRQSVPFSLFQDLTCYKEDGGWRLWNCPGGAEDLATLLLSANSQQRQQLLSQQGRLLNQDLIKSLLEKVRQMDGQKFTPAGLNGFNLALSLAERIGDQSGILQAHTLLGDASRSHSDNPSAEEHYLKALEAAKALGDHEGSAESLNHLATLSLSQGALPRACEYYERSLQEYELSQNKVALADTLEALGNIYYDGGDYRRAANWFKRSLDARPPEYTAGSERVLVNLGNSYLGMKDHGEAVEAYQIVLARLGDSADKSLISQLHGNLASVFLRQRDYPKALEHYGQALSLLEAVADKSGVALTLEAMGNVCFEKGDFPSALGYFQKVVPVQESLNSSSGTAAALNNLGRTYLAMERFEMAVQLFDDSLRKFEASNDYAGALGALQNLGNARYSQANYSEALAIYEKALKLARQANDRQSTVNALLGIGTVKTCQGDFPQALDLFRKGLKIAEELGDKANVAALLHNMGLAFASQNNFGLALDHYTQSLRLSEELLDNAGSARTLGNIGAAHSAAGNYSSALECHQKALRLEESLGNQPGVARALGHLGGVYFMESHFQEALDHFQKSLDLWNSLNDPSGIASTLSYMGDTYYSQQDFIKALDFYQKSLELMQSMGNKEATASLFTGIAQVQLALGKPEPALVSAQEALTIAERIGNPEIFWYANFLAGDSYRAKKQTNEAREAYSLAMATIERIRNQAGVNRLRQKFRESKSAPFRAMFELLCLEGNAFEALALAEQAKLQDLLDIFDPNQVSISKGMSSQEREEEQRLADQLRSLNLQVYRERLQLEPSIDKLRELENQLKSAQFPYDTFRKALASNHPQLAAYRGQLQYASADDLSLMLTNRRAAILEFVSTRDETYLLTVIAKPVVKELDGAGRKTSAASAPEISLQLIPLRLSRKQLSEQVYTFREKIVLQAESYQKQAEWLYQSLLKPVAPVLAGRNHLLLIPDGVLWLLPFEALQTIPNHYLLEDFSISYARSISECLSNAKAENSKKSRQAHVAPLLILGDPIPSKVVSERLQAFQLHGVLDEETNSTTEIPALRKLYGPNLATVLTGNQASKDRLKKAMNQQFWLHLAVPGMVDDLNPLYSTLYLSPSILEETDDGQFDARELLDLDWDCDLAILSGSQQPQERTRTGEGLVALSWAFNVAGCRAIVVNRWKATPESKTQLMKELHRRLRLGQSRTGVRIPASECLRQAALTMIRSPQFNHPHFWSSAMVLGSW